MPAPKDPEKRELWKQKISETLKQNPIKFWFGKSRDKETRQKISESLKGNIPWNKGRTNLFTGTKNPMWGKCHSEETKRQISEFLLSEKNSWRGKHQSGITKKKISESLIGKKNPMWGKHHSEESRRKMSEANLGRIPWHKDRTGVYSEETLKKMSESHKGRIKSKEERVRLSKALKGHNLSEETRKKISESRKGQKPSEATRKKLSIAGMGRKLSEESKRKISEFHTGRPVSKETRKKISESEKGKYISEEIRLKMSESHLGEKNYNWRGGVSSLSQMIRKCATYKLWQQAVFHKDKFQCQDCGKIGGDLHAHHNYSFHKLMKDYNIQSLGQAVRTEELWDINNGITLCIKCHKKRHKRNQSHEKIENLLDNRHTARSYKVSAYNKRITEVSGKI